MSKMRSQGITLVVSLMILFILTMIAITAIRMTTLDEKIVYNSTDLTRAFQSAESALESAEKVIENLSDTTAFTNANGYYQEGSSPDPFASATWSGSSSIQGPSASGTSAPRYYIELNSTAAGQNSSDTSMNMTNYGEETGAVENSTAFRVIARGTGGNNTSQSVLESYYWRTF